MPTAPDYPPARERPASRTALSLRSSTVRRVLYQVLAVALLVLLMGWMVGNTLENMRARGIQSGFGFLTQPIGLDIGESVIAFNSSGAYWKAFLAGALNTVRVAVPGIALTTVLGVLIGLGRFSRNAIMRGLCAGYVELFRNIPILIQLLIWYVVLVELLPDPQEALNLAHLAYLSKGGFSLPVPVASSGWAWIAGGLALGLLGAWTLRTLELRRFLKIGGRLPSLYWRPLLALAAGVTLGGLVGGTQAQWDVPRPGGFAIEGGLSLTPEFLTVLLGLALYTAAFVAEIVRAGVVSIGRGQVDAAHSIGLSHRQTLRLVVLPQALRVIIPPMTNQYLNLTKNSSLAVAVGYPDVVSIANTALNQTGRAVECIAIIMAVYLTLSLVTSVLMNLYNRRVAIQER